MAEGGAARRRLNIVVVDDSAVMRSIISRALHMSGLPIGEIHQAENGCRALEIFEQTGIDFATIDINMAEMSGCDLIDCMHAAPETARLPVLVISSENSEATIRDVRRRGAAFLHKPFTPEALREAVMKLLGLDDA